MTKPYLGEAASTYEARRKGKALWRQEDQILLRILQETSPQETVLDIPVGTGRFLPFYRDHQLRVVGIDLSADMLAIAKPRGHDAVLKRGDIRNIPAGDKSVDVSICFRLLYFMKLGDVKKALRELARVTRKRIVFSARFTHRKGPKAEKVITHDWEEFRKVLPPGWQVVRRHTVKDLPSDEYLVCEMEPQSKKDK